MDIDGITARISIDHETGCWIWGGALMSHRWGVGGYGRIHDRLAHRVVYQLLVGPIPEGLELDHTCRRPPCLNPDHLEPVTHGENVLRWARTITHCPKGHEYSPENTYRRGNSRFCRACNRDAVRRYKLRRTGAVA